MSDRDPDPVPSLAREAIDLYRGPLADVRFPDVDRDALDAAELELLEAHRAVLAAELALERARAELAERASTLVAKSQRALAYARVYAEGAPELRERVDAIAVPTKRSEVAQPASVPRRSRRSRKQGDGASLFEAPPPDPAPDADAITDAA
jgi:hypothetical protein